MNIRLCYRISANAGFAQDKDGNNTEAYICSKMGNAKSYDISTEKYKAAQEGMKKILANQLKCSADMLTSITLNEYLDHTEEEDN